MGADKNPVFRLVLPGLGEINGIVPFRIEIKVASEPSGYFNHIPLFGFEPLLKKCRQVNLSNETYPLGILFIGRGQFLFTRNFPYPFLWKVAYGEKDLRKLFLVKLA